MERRTPRAARRAAESKAEQADVDRVHVSDTAVATIVGLAAHEVPGVVGMAPASLGEGLRRVLGLAQVSEGVEVVRDGDGQEVGVALHVVVAYGVNIPVVADSVRERVEHATRAYCGLKATSITVRVAGVSRA
jgi:uncharacterized alkaline shock family protein YloU